MQTVIHRQPVTNENLDKICDRYISLGWKEHDIISDIHNHVSAIEFIWNGEGHPQWPILSDLL